MEDLISAIIKSNDLVAARKLFSEQMAKRTTDLIEECKIDIARNFLIEGEHIKEDEDEDETKDKKSKGKDKDESDDADEPDEDDEDDE